MEAVIVITILALLQYTIFGIQVGSIRGKTGVKAPAMSGGETFERMNRVHQNTLETLIVFLPALWLYAHYVNPVWGAALGAVYLVGRIIYRRSYMNDPSSRTVGYAMSILPVLVMLLWVLVKTLLTYI